MANNATQQIVNKAWSYAKSAAESPRGAGPYFTPREQFAAIAAELKR